MKLLGSAMAIRANTNPPVIANSRRNLLARIADIAVRIAITSVSKTLLDGGEMLLGFSDSTGSTRSSFRRGFSVDTSLELIDLGLPLVVQAVLDANPFPNLFENVKQDVD